MIQPRRDNDAASVPGELVARSVGRALRDTCEMPVEPAEERHTWAQPRGLTFVEMAAGEAAQTALDRCDETDMAGRGITVNEARPRPQRGDDGGFPRRSEPRW